MTFNIQNQFVRPGSFQADRDLGKHVEAQRFDDELDDVADALTGIKQQMATLTAGALFNPSLYTTTTQLNGLLAQKQGALGYTPVDQASAGQPGSFAPLNSSGQIDAQYLPTVGSVGAAGVQAFMGRTGNVSLIAGDVAGALGYTPANTAHTHGVSEISGLQSHLDGKQPALGFTPANQTHQHPIADVTGLQAELGTKVSVSTSAVASETSFPIGSIVLVRDATVGPPALRGVQAIRVDVGTQTYNWSVGPFLAGQWRSIGSTPTLNVLNDGSNYVGSVLMQRTA